jgi:hypothetical protein
VTSLYCTSRSCSFFTAGIIDREKVLGKYYLFAGNSLFPRTFYTYKPYEGCHRRPHRRDGTPSHAVFLPTIAARRPRSPLVRKQATSPSSPLLGRAHLTFVRPESTYSDAFPVLPGQLPAQSSPLSNTLTHTTNVTSSLHRHASPFAKSCHVHWSTIFMNFSSSCNLARKRALHQSDPLTGPHKARGLTTRRAPHTPTALSAHYTKQASFSRINSFPDEVPHATFLDRISALTQNEKIGDPDLSCLNIPSPASPTTAHLPPRPLAHPQISLGRLARSLSTMMSCFVFTIWWTRFYWPLPLRYLFQRTLISSSPKPSRSNCATATSAYARDGFPPAPEPPLCASSNFGGPHIPWR